MTAREKYSLSFTTTKTNSERFYHHCYTENTDHDELSRFISRLDDDSTSDLIREITTSINQGKSWGSLESDPWEDMSVGIEFPSFYIEEYKLPLADMKNILFEWLEYIRPGAQEFFSDIETMHTGSIRQGWLFKFKYSIDESGKRRNTCESLIKYKQPLCFVQVCTKKDCEYLITQIDKALNSRSYDREPFSNKQAGILIRIDPPWFRIGNHSSDKDFAMGLDSVKPFLKEWLEFINES